MNKILIAAFVIIAIVLSFLIFQLYQYQPRSVISYHQQPTYTIYLYRCWY